MKEKSKLNNLKLNFTLEKYKTRSSYPSGDYLNKFLENYDLKKILTYQEELSLFIKEFDNYCKYQRLKGIELQSGEIYSPNISFDRTRKDQLKNGYIPIVLWFNETTIYTSFVYFSWGD